MRSLSKANLRVYFALFFMLIGVIASAQKYAEIYPENVKKACFFWKKHKNRIELLAKKHTLDPVFMFAIVAPEVSQFSAVSDFAEVRLLETFYVEFGDEYANFSIGFFQMKPSFAEKIENYLKKIKRLEFSDLYSYESGFSETEIRAKRIEKLKKIEFQLMYLAAYICIADILFQSIRFSSKIDRLQFFASAYNYGFDQNIQKINNWQRIAAFPARSLKQTFPYALVASDFYNSLCKP